MHQRSEELRVQSWPDVYVEAFISPDSTSLKDTMKSIVVRVAGNANALVVPYSETLLNALVDARVVKLDTTYHPQTITTFKLQDNQVRVEVINDSSLDNSDEIKRIEKQKSEYFARLEADAAALEDKIE